MKNSQIFIPVLFTILLCVLVICIKEEGPTNLKTKCFKPKVTLPDKLIIGYANWNQCDEKIIEAAKNGVNVIIWFSIDLLHNSSTGEPYINRGPDPDCVANVSSTLKQLNLETIHLISVGGWNSLHPDTNVTPQASFNEWKRWNEKVVARPDLGFFGYDGLDWDIEGTDEISNARNTFTPEVLDFMGVFSQLVKQDGFIMSMAPAESYLDPSTSLFDRNLTHVYEEWEPIAPNFKYHGHNPYSYLISRYGQYEDLCLENTNDGSVQKPTFDFIMIQLYEGYSRTLYNTSILGQPASEYIRNIVEKFDQGWTVLFSSDPSVNWKTAEVRVEPSKLVIGLANGWADNTKFLLLSSVELCKGYEDLQEIGKTVRGFGYWNIFDEGRNIPNGEELWLAKDLDRILRIRNQNGTDLC